MSLETLDLFEQMQDPDIRWLLANSEVIPVEAGEAILREGEPPAHIFFIADGQFDVNAYSGSETLTYVGRLQPGDIVGEISWLDRKPASGSVTAIESAMVLRLPVSTLEAKLKSDPQFGAQFLRGVAVLLASRLRKTTTQLRNATASTGSDKDGRLGQCLADVKSAVARLDTDAVSEEASKALRASLRTLESEVHGKDLPFGLAEALRHELRPIVSRSTVGSRCVSRPRGFAGDFVTQDLVYHSKPAGSDAAGAVIATALYDLDGFRALRGRLHLMVDLLRTSARSQSGPLSITYLNAGAAPEVFELLSDPQLAARLTITCVEVDREAAAALERNVVQQGVAAAVHVVQANLLHLASGRDELGLEPQDIIACTGLYDVTGDDSTVKLLNWTHGLLKPGGSTFVGLISPANKSDRLFSEVLDWKITHRSEEDFKTLLHRSQFDSTTARFMKDTAHPGYLAVAKKT